jgi:hypothetical protein
MAFETITTNDKSKRDQMFQELRNSDQPNERQVVKFSGVESTMTDDGEVMTAISTWSVAYPTRVSKQNHGSARNPRKFPGRKKAS